MRRLLCFVAMLLAASLLASIASAQDASPAASPGPGCATPTVAEAETIANAYFGAFNSGDLEALDDLLAADYLH